MFRMLPRSPSMATRSSSPGRLSGVGDGGGEQGDRSGRTHPPAAAATEGARHLVGLLYQIGFALPRMEKALLLRACNERYFLPSVQCPDRDVFPVVFQNAVVKSNRPVFAENALLVFIQFVGISHFCDQSDNHLRRQPKLLTDGLINQPMQFELTKGFRFPRKAGNLIGRFVCTLKRFAQGDCLFFGGH